MALFLDENVLVDAAHPHAELIVVAHDAEGARAHAGGLAIGRDINHGLVLHVIVKEAVLDVLLAVEIQVPPHARRTDIDSAHRDFDRALIGEDPGEIVPLVPREVIAVDRVEILDVDCVVQKLKPVTEIGDRLGEAVGILLLDSLVGIFRHVGVMLAGHWIVVMERRHEDSRIGLVLHTRAPVGRRIFQRTGVRNGGLAPAVLIGRIHRRIEMQAGDLPDAVLLDVVVLEHAEAPMGIFAVHGLLREHVPATFSGLAVGRDIDDAL